MLCNLLFALTFISANLAIPRLDSLDFFVIGDWGGIPNPPFSTDIERSVSRKLMNIANMLKIDFLLALGDNFYYNGVESEFDSRFQTSFEQVFNYTDLEFPWYFIAGNHDWHGNVSAQMAYTNHSTRWKFPNYFYTIEETLPDDSNKKIAIIMLDTVLLCGLVSSDFDDSNVYKPLVNQYLTDVYWKFIKDELVRVQNYAYVVVTGHYPVWSVGHHGPTQKLVDRLDPLLKQYNVTAYLNGHDHTMEHIQVPFGSNRTMNYFTIGAANFYDNSKKHAKSIPTNSLKFHWKNTNSLGGLALISVTSNILQIDFLSTEGESIYTTKILPRN